MLDDSFKIRYKTLSVATHSQSSFYPTKPHNHNEFEILNITGGSSVVYIGDKSYAVKCGDIVFINPMEVHSVIVNEDMPYSHQCICFDCSIIMNDRLSESLKSECMCITHHIRGESEHSGYLKELFEKAFEACTREEKNYEMSVTAYITLMFACLLKNSLTDKERVKPENIDFNTEVIRYISEHYRENITSKQAAEALMYNQSYFCRNFKKNFGMTFSSYLKIHRISLSRRMLETGNDTISDIAFQCGFENPSYFSKCFRECFGLLPNEYRGQRG